jgi:hypothetical protein
MGVFATRSMAVSASTMPCTSWFIAFVPAGPTVSSRPSRLKRKSARLSSWAILPGRVHERNRKVEGERAGAQQWQRHAGDDLFRGRNVDCRVRALAQERRRTRARAGRVHLVQVLFRPLRPDTFRRVARRGRAPARGKRRRRRQRVHRRVERRRITLRRASTSIGAFPVAGRALSTPVPPSILSVTSEPVAARLVKAGRENGAEVGPVCAVLGAEVVLGGVREREREARGADLAPADVRVREGGKAREGRVGRRAGGGREGDVDPDEPGEIADLRAVRWDGEEGEMRGDVRGRRASPSPCGLRSSDRRKSRFCGAQRQAMRLWNWHSYLNTRIRPTWEEEKRASVRNQRAYKWRVRGRKIGARRGRKMEHVRRRRRRGSPSW